MDTTEWEAEVVRLRGEAADHEHKAEEARRAKAEAEKACEALALERKQFEKTATGLARQMQEVRGPPTKMQTRILCPRGAPQ